MNTMYHYCKKKKRKPYHKKVFPENKGQDIYAKSHNFMNTVLTNPKSELGIISLNEQRNAFSNCCEVPCYNINARVFCTSYFFGLKSCVLCVCARMFCFSIALTAGSRHLQPLLMKI